MANTTCDWDGPYGECQNLAKWWVSEGPKRFWVPRCGRHALMPPFTLRQRVPITEPLPQGTERLSENSARGGQ